MSFISLFRAGFVAAALCFSLVMSIAPPARAAGDIVAFCKSHGTLDYPDKTYFAGQYKPGMVPRQVAAVEATNWRCANGRVLLCQNSADGDSCAKKDPSRIPSDDIRESCVVNDMVARAVSAYSASTWDCKNKRAVIA